MALDWDKLAEEVRHFATEDPLKEWPTEVNHLTPWVVENLDQIGDLIGRRLEFRRREFPIGDFRADILAVDEDGRRIIIEGQLGRTDHKHFAQVVLYAINAQADEIIWIATGELFTGTGVRREHKHALERLNELFAGRTVFHAISLTLESRPTRLEEPAGPVAPLLYVIAGPRSGQSIHSEPDGPSH